MANGSLYEHLPYFEDSSGHPRENDTSTYETVELSELPSEGPQRGEDFDNCCYPRSSRRR